MMLPHHLLRDATLLSVVTTAGALVVDGRLGLELGVGAVAGLANVGLWLIAGYSLLHGGLGRAMLPVKLFAAVGLVWALQRWVPGAPAFVGFSLPLVAMIGRVLLGHPTHARVG